MKYKNICKFPPSSPIKDLTICCFVFETEEKTMRRGCNLTANRMILIEQGEGSFLLGGVSHDFVVGTLLFGFEGESFVLEKGENVQYLYIDFKGSRSESLFRTFGIYPSARKGKNLKGLIPFCKDSLFNTPQESIDIAAESVLLYFFSRLAATSSVRNDILQKILEYTEEHFNDVELSLAGVAETLGYNAKYLSHYFKTKTGTTYNNYLRSLRFKHAISLFEHGISSIKNVAILSGFSDPLYFSTAFKKEIGVTPKEFISKLSSPEP